MCVYVYSGVFTCVSVCTCIHAYTCTCVCVCVCVSDNPAGLMNGDGNGLVPFVDHGVNHRYQVKGSAGVLYTHTHTHKKGKFSVSAYTHTHT